MFRRVGVAVGVALSVALALLLLWPDGEVVRRANLELYLFFLHRGVPRAVTPEWYATVLNVLIFVPPAWLGVRLLRWRPLLVVALLGGASAVVETVQLVPVLQRNADLVDVLCNTGGALLGALLGSVGRSRSGLEQAGSDELVDEPHDVVGDELR
ncbi:VanZ family protein [Phycicoccus sp. CSK15P-2]|uniref:VanZ family protein n=1 Tax=Phycicoccus sp. CSK15P-2 TaxID=2807627 RepID=UPI0019528ADB|nr:VanZ family protein [Phycicoccus sp. CSK15P-2]MBM6404325.1 VanZ family protein [Phycicoccus sp. CSK15P-2]